MHPADSFFNGHHLERRRAQRFAVTFPVRVVWTTAEKIVRITGETTDVSTHGLRLITDQPIPVRSNVKARVDFRAGMKDRLLSLSTVGVVLRQEPLRNGKTALVIKNYRHELLGAVAEEMAVPVETH